MSHSLQQSSAGAHRLIPEVDRKPAKASLGNPERAKKTTTEQAGNDEVSEFQRLIGRCLDRARLMRGWSVKELTAAISEAEGRERDERQIGRWLCGAERPHLDKFWAVADLRPLIVLALADLAGAGVDVETTVRIRRAS